MRIIVLSDTHVPRAAPDMPQAVYDEILNCDMIIHAGDFVEKGFYDKLKSLKTIHAVYGNMDGPDIRHLLHDKEIIPAGSLKIGLIHGFGPPRELADTVSKEFGNVDAIVFGHSHSPVNIVKNGVLLFNPGSPTDTIFAETNSYGILEVTDKKIEGKIIKL